MKKLTINNWVLLSVTVVGKKLSVFDDEDEGWDLLPRAIKTLLRSIYQDISVRDTGSGSWFLSYSKTYVKLWDHGVVCMDKKNNLHKVIPRPFGEQCKCNNDTHSSPISRRLEQGTPTDIGCYILIEINCCFDFLKFELYERIIALWSQKYCRY